MTIQSLFLLHLLKKAQIYEDNNVSIFLKEMVVKTNPINNKDTKEVYISKFKHSLTSALNDLLDDDYISYDNKSTFSSFQVHVRHKGWHTTQSILLRSASFLFKSVAVPITVSIFTAIITMFIALNV